MTIFISNILPVFPHFVRKAQDLNVQEEQAPLTISAGCRGLKITMLAQSRNVLILNISNNVAFIFIGDFMHTGNSVNLARDLINAAQDPWNEQTSKNLRLEGISDVSHIIGGLYISNDACFIETSRTNPNGFQSIVSACGFSRIQRANSEVLTAVQRSTVETRFQERKIEWLQIGDAVPDDPQAWTDIVFNATFPESPLTRVDFEIARNSTKPEDMEFRAKKRTLVQQHSADRWFKPTFDVLKEAINGKKTLVHCLHGRSRSAAVVIAFFIKEYHVTAEQGLAFLRTKRSCVDPKCIDDLKQYAQSLNEQAQAR